MSSYKNQTTLKGLVGISPEGAITFISQLYTGSVSDREIVRRNGLLDLPFNDNDSVITDKGFAAIGDLIKFACLPRRIKSNACRRCGKNSRNSQLEDTH